MVFVVIAFPSLVTHYKDEHTGIDPNSISIELPTLGGGELTMPSFGDSSGGTDTSGGLGLPPLNFGGDTVPSTGGDSSGGLGLPPLTFGNDTGPNMGGDDEPTKAAEPAVDLTQPPSFN